MKFDKFANKYKISFKEGFNMDKLEDYGFKKEISNLKTFIYKKINKKTKKYVIETVIYNKHEISTFTRQNYETNNNPNAICFLYGKPFKSKYLNFVKYNKDLFRAGVVSVM